MDISTLTTGWFPGTYKVRHRLDSGHVVTRDLTDMKVLSDGKRPVAIRGEWNPAGEPVRVPIKWIVECERIDNPVAAVKPVGAAASAGRHGGGRNAASGAVGCPSSGVTSKSTSRHGPGFLSVVFCGLVLAFIHYGGMSESSAVRYTPPPASLSRDFSTSARREVRTLPAPLPPPAPGPPTPAPPKEERLWYRGEEIVRTRSATGVRYTHSASGTVSRSLQEARTAINSRRLWRETGIRSADLIAEFVRADADSDGNLSWQEIETFQERLHASYRYEVNRTALRPEAFYANGGGDCEDWSLVTCALLQFWGIDCAVGTLANRQRTLFHAVALIRVPSPPSGYTYFDVGASQVPPDGTVAPGFYVPIDYERVGGVTNAAGPDWPLVEIHDPVELYGTVM